MLSLMVTIVGLRLRHHQPDNPVPHRLKSLLLMMAAVTCQCTSLAALQCSSVNIDTHDYHGNKEKIQNEKRRKEKISSHDMKNGNVCKNNEDHLPEVGPNMGTGSSTGSSPWELAAVIFDRFFRRIVSIHHHRV